MPPHHVRPFTDTLVSNLLLVQEKAYLALPSDKFGNSAPSISFLKKYSSTKQVVETLEAWGFSIPVLTDNKQSHPWLCLQSTCIWVF